MSGTFSVSSGKIIAPSGQPFVAEGIGLFDSDAMSSSMASTILNQFPGINMVRVACYSYDSPSSLQNFITQMTSKGVVVELEDHNTSNAVLTGSALTTESDWYASLAGAFAGNPYVWFGTMNEPGVGDSGQQLATYNAIRGTGNNNPIMLEAGPGAGQPDPTQGVVASDYNSMQNVVWDMHYYDWMSGYSSNQSTVSAELASQVSAMQTVTSADGRIPVIIGEYGNATDGVNIDPGGTAVVTAVNTAAETSGGIAWIWNNPGTANTGADTLTNRGASLTSYGQQVAAYIAAGDPPSGNPPPPPPSGTAITPGVGSFTDGAGNTYTLGANGAATENGAPIPGGSGTAEMAFDNGQVYGQDASNQQWYIWNQQDWTAASAPPAGGSHSGGGTGPGPGSGGSTPSPNDTVVTAGSGGAIIDNAGNKWTIASGGQIVVNGAADTTTANVTELAFVNGHIWQENASKLWWEKTSASAPWVYEGNTSPLPAGSNSPKPSPNDTVVKAGSSGTIIDNVGNKWTITGGGQIAVNGTVDTTTANVTELAFVNGNIWQENASTLWWEKTSASAPWSPSSGTPTSPLPTGTASALVVSSLSTTSDLSSTGSALRMSFIGGSPGPATSATSGNDLLAGSPSTASGGIGPQDGVSALLGNAASHDSSSPLPDPLPTDGTARSTTATATGVGASSLILDAQHNTASLDTPTSHHSTL